MQIFQSFQVLHPHQRSALGLLGDLQHFQIPSCIEQWPSVQFGTIDHIQSLHKFPYIYPIFLLLMSYNALYFYLKLPINYPIFCSECAFRPASVDPIAVLHDQIKSSHAWSGLEFVTFCLNLAYYLLLAKSHKPMLLTNAVLN